METSFNILFATDFSQSVMNSERYAVQFAKHTHSYLRFIHVLRPYIGIPTNVEPERLDDDSLDFEIERLQNHALNVMKSIGIKPEEINYDCVVREGNIREEIMEEAFECGSDLIIAGTHGVGLLQKLMLGSHTWDIIKNAEVPVLAVPEDALFTGIKNIAFATEYREEEINVIQLLNEMAMDLHASLTVLHIANYALSKEFETLLFRRFKDQVKSKLPNSKLEIRLVHNDDKVTGLNEFCENNQINWLVMSTQKSNWLEELINLDADKTRRMSFNTHVPLLIIPDSYYPVTHPDVMLKTI